jgi:predicted secreted protein
MLDDESRLGDDRVGSGGRAVGVLRAVRFGTTRVAATRPWEREDWVVERFAVDIEIGCRRRAAMTGRPPGR